MRKIAPKTAAPLLALCLLLAACGGGKPAAPFDPDKTVAAFTAAGVFSEALEPLDTETAATLYGIDAADVTACAVSTSLTAGAEECAVLVLKDETAAAAAKTCLERRIDDQKAALKDYQPAEVAKLDGALLEQRGNSVLLVVAADAAQAQTALDGLGK